MILGALADFFANSLQWSAGNAIREGLGAQAWQRLAGVTNPAIAAADRSLIAQFYAVVRQGVQAANVLLAGGRLNPSDVPVAPGLPLAQRYGTFGVVEIGTGLQATGGNPVTATLPFLDQSPGLPTAQQLESKAEEYAQSIPPETRTGSPRGRRMTQRWDIVQAVTDQPQHAITPLFVFRTS